MPGRRPKPEDQKKLESAPLRSKRKGAKRGAKPKPPKAAAPAGIPPMPSWLSPRIRPTWNAIIPELAKRVALHRIDSAALADLATCVFRMNQAERQIDKHGVLIKGAKGNPVKNPAIQIARQYRYSVQRWFSVFGLTPADRSKVPASTAADVPDDDPLAAAQAALGLADERTVH